jgi:serine/threonine-protein kinase HipA
MELRATEILNVGLDFGMQQRKVGRMAQRRHEIFFEYDPSFLADPLPISPLRLPLKSGLQTVSYQPFEGLFGVFNDSLPDGWGRLLLDRALSGRGIAPQTIGPLDRLAYVGLNGMGALTYWPEIAAAPKVDGSLDLDVLANEMALVLEGEPSALLDQLYQIGGSSSGARPKIVVGYDPETDRLSQGYDAAVEGYQSWLIKFPATADSKDIARVEYAYACMAVAAGLEMTAVRLFEGKSGRSYFGTQRFDHDHAQRLHMHTATGLLHTDHRVPSLDYETLLRLALHLNNDIREAEKLYRLAAFNVMAHNRDDHGKNFSFLMTAEGCWRFAPAYDLTFSAGPGGEQSTTVMGEGRAPGMAQLLKLGEQFSLRARKEILEEVATAVAAWPSFADEAGLSKASTSLIQKYHRMR